MEPMILLEQPLSRGGVYVIMNILEKKAYVGETYDFYFRLPKHILGIFFNNTSTNISLRLEKNKNFYIFEALHTDYNKNATNEKTWICHETIYMYLLRKYGYALYNGNNEYKDNFGKKREFLMGDGPLADDAKEKLLNCIKTVVNDTEENLLSLMKAAEVQMNADILRVFGISLEQLSNMEYVERYRVWNTIIRGTERNKTGDGVKIINNVKSVRKICNAMFARKLSKKDMEECGVKRLAIDDFCTLVKEGKLDRIVVSKMGHYLDQSPKTILSTKCMDISRKEIFNGFYQENIEGCCFWAVQNINLYHTRKVLLEENENKDPRYMILRYTPSQEYKKIKDREDDYGNLNPEDETMDAFFIRMKEMYEIIKKEGGAEFTLSKFFNDGKLKKKTEEMTIPNWMFPLIASTTRTNRVFVISELMYIDAEYEDLSEMMDCFVSRTESGDACNFKNMLKQTLNGPKSHSCAELINRQNLMDYMTNNTNRTNKEECTSFLIAKLEYPYMYSAL